MSELQQSLYRSLPLSVGARGLLESSASPAELLETLMERRLVCDAIYLLARLLPIRQSVWWGCLSVWYLGEAKALSPTERAALRQAVYWVYAPCSTFQSSAFDSAQTAGPHTPAGAIATAAFYGGSAPSEDQPIQPISPAKVGSAVASAVFLSAAYLAQAKRTANTFEAYCQLIQVARDIAEKPERWDDHSITQGVIQRLYGD